MVYKCVLKLKDDGFIVVLEENYLFLSKSQVTLDRLFIHKLVSNFK